MLYTYMLWNSYTIIGVLCNLSIHIVSGVHIKICAGEHAYYYYRLQTTLAVLGVIWNKNVVILIRIICATNRTFRVAKFAENWLVAYQQDFPLELNVAYVNICYLLRVLVNNDIFSDRV